MNNTNRQRQVTRVITVLSLIASTAVGVIHAACWDTGATPRPTSQYVVQSSTGTVVDTVTGLMWKQCGEGLSGTDCSTGNNSFINLDAANPIASASVFAGYNDWRVPTLTELQSLLPSDCLDPRINSNVFPNTVLNDFWSSSPIITVTGYAWAVLFDNGTPRPFLRTYTTVNLRLVRAGQSFGVSTPKSQTLTFNAPPTLPFGGTAVVTATRTAPNSGNPVVYASSTTAVCTVNASSGALGLVNTAQVGDTCTVSANLLGRAANGENYAQAAQVTQSIIVSKAAQILTFSPPPAISVGGTGGVAATSNQGLTPVMFSSTTSGVCSVSGANGSTVTGVAVGICTITASQSGNTTYLGASANQSFSIGPTYLVCNLHMDGANPMLATKEGLILLRAMLGFTGTAVTAGTGITTPWDTIRAALNLNCGTSF